MYELSGKLLKIFDTVEISDKFKKREFVVEKTTVIRETEFTDPISFEIKQDRCSLLDNFKEGDQVNVFFNVRGREWTKDGETRYFSNLECWKISGTTGDATSTQTSTPTTEKSSEAHDDLGKDDLPF